MPIVQSRHKESADLRCRIGKRRSYHAIQVKQNTMKHLYSRNKTPYPFRIRHETMLHLQVYRYFGLFCFLEVAKFLFAKTQSVNKHNPCITIYAKSIQRLRRHLFPARSKKQYSPAHLCVNCTAQMYKFFCELTNSRLTILVSGRGETYWQFVTDVLVAQEVLEIELLCFSSPVERSNYLRFDNLDLPNPLQRRG